MVAGIIRCHALVCTSGLKLAERNVRPSASATTHHLPLGAVFHNQVLFVLLIILLKERLGTQDVLPFSFSFLKLGCSFRQVVWGQKRDILGVNLKKQSLLVFFEIRGQTKTVSFELVVVRKRLSDERDRVAYPFF